MVAKITKDNLNCEQSLICLSRLHVNYCKRHENEKKGKKRNDRKTKVLRTYKSHRRNRNTYLLNNFNFYDLKKNHINNKIDHESKTK